MWMNANTIIICCLCRLSSRPPYKCESSENLRLEVSFQPCIKFRLGGGYDGLTCACLSVTLCFFSVVFRGLLFDCVPLRTTRFVFDSFFGTCRTLAFMSLLLLLLHISQLAHGVSFHARFCSHDQNRHRYRHRHRHRCRCCVVRKRTEYMWLERLSDLLYFLAIFYMCNLRPSP
jgi:hypothetical protein